MMRSRRNRSRLRTKDRWEEWIKYCGIAVIVNGYLAVGSIKL